MKGPTMSYYVDEFVNSNPVNVQFDEEAFDSQEELVFDLFKKLVDWDPARRSDDSKDDAYPVIVLEKDNMPVAWYDLEMFCGYVQA
jgi:hypothetical protein